MDNEESPLSLIVFSGTDDKLTSAGVLAVGAAAMGRKVNVFLQYYAVDAFRAGHLLDDHGLSPEATPRIADQVRGHGAHWSELFAQAKEVGEVDIEACALTMDLFHLTKDDLDPIVDGVEGVASFMASAETGPVAFI